MLYGSKDIQEEILGRIAQFEKKYNKKVVFGALVGSISKGMERYDSDYDTRFLYLDCQEQGFARWDKIDHIKECQIHQCYIPSGKERFITGDDYRNRYCEIAERDEGLFYDKIAFWELTSYLHFLKKPELDDRFSVGLYHIVSWTFNSPFCWDPYGIKSKLSCLVDEMFIAEYEIQYYKGYIQRALKKDPVMIREYIYSIYYALAIEYCMEKNRFAPVYFKSLLAFCNDPNLKSVIVDLETEYYDSAKEIEMGINFKRKAADILSIKRNEFIDGFLENVLVRAERYHYNNVKTCRKDYVDAMINIVFDSLERPKVKDIND